MKEKKKNSVTQPVSPPQFGSRNYSEWVTKKKKKISMMQTISMVILQRVCLISLHHKNVTVVVPIHAFYFTPVFISVSCGRWAMLLS